MAEKAEDHALVSVKTLPFAYDPENLTKSTLRLAYAVRPEWAITPHEVEIHPFSEGLMNQLLKITRNAPGRSQYDTDKEAIMLRAYGDNTDLLVDREAEVATHGLLEQRQLAAPLLARFENGLLYGFTPGRVCTTFDISQEHVWRAVAAKIGEWHAKMPLSDSRSGCSCRTSTGLVTIWTEMERWICSVPSENETYGSRLTLLRGEVERSREELSDQRVSSQLEPVFGHTDLLAANIILPCEDGSDPRVSKVDFIDYEFACPCAAAYDLANHFAEWAGFELDYSLIPTRSLRRSFVEEYLHSYDSFVLLKCEDFDSLVDELMAQVDSYRGIPGLRWGIQSIVQEYLHPLPDFDFAEYGKKRLSEYWAWRAEEDGSRISSGEEVPLRERRWAQEE